MRRGRPVKHTPSPQLLPLSSPDPFVKLGTTSSTVQFHFTASSDDDDIHLRYPTIEELSGGEFTTSPRSQSQPPSKTIVEEQVNALADNAFALPVQPYHRTKEADALTDQVFKPDRRRSPAAQIRAALERGKDSADFVAPNTTPPDLLGEAEEEQERVIKPSEVLAKGGIYAPYSIPAPPPVNLAPGIESRTRRKVEESRRIIDESRKILDAQWPDTKEPVPSRPAMVSIGTMTSPPPSPPMKPAESHTGPLSAKLGAAKLGSPRLPQRLTLQKTDLKSHTTDYPRPESPRPRSRDDMVKGKGAPHPRPQSLFVNDLDFLRSYDDKEKLAVAMEKSHTGLSTSSQPVSLPSTSSDVHALDSEEQPPDLEYLRIKDEENKSPQFARQDGSSRGARRSASSGPAGPVKHSRQTSLGVLSNGIMSGKFSEAFRKFEGLGHHENKPESRLRAEKTLAKNRSSSGAGEERVLEDGEDWVVETHELPIKVKEHLSQTRRSLERTSARGGVYGIPGGKVSSGGARGGGKKARSIQQRMNDYLNAQSNEKPAPLTADGYGPYISDARAVRNVADEETEDEKGVAAPYGVAKSNSVRLPPASLKGSVQ